MSKCQYCNSRHTINKDMEIKLDKYHTGIVERTTICKDCGAVNLDHEVKLHKNTIAT